MKLTQILLEQFEPDMARQLIAFGHKLSKIDADIFVFLARKSLCLYDVLLKLGTPPIEHCVVSDRLLDMRLDPFQDKRVALVDDTLIVGTSLAKAKKALEEVGADVSTHVFCLDQRWYCRDLIVPTTVAVESSDDRIMTFCTAEVRALSLMPRPYLVDFPLTRPFRVRNEELDSLLAQTSWSPMKLSTILQERNGVAVLTFFPSGDMEAQLKRELGPTVFKCLDLIKVRLWARRSSRNSWVAQAVPIVTLKPLTEGTLKEFNEHLLTAVLRDKRAGVRLTHAADSPRARQRLSQFILSAAVGQKFMGGVDERVGRKLRWRYDHDETDRHFGPWLHDETTAMAENASARLLRPMGPTQPTPKFRPAAIPESVRQWTATSIGTDPKRERLRTQQRRDRSVSLLADFAEIFHHIYDNREIPAREEAREAGARCLDPNFPMPNRDRLEKGIPWQLLVEWLAGLCGVAKSAHVMQTFSLLLDLCNDVGIAVPVTCVQEGVVYRGYRHGEDVKFSDGELALAYDVAEAFLESSGLPAIPRLTLEKLLVLLIKIGASNGFLQVLYGASGTDGVCEIGFDLKGARPLFTHGPKHRAERDLWLTEYLISRKVVRTSTKVDERRGEYQLGKRPQGNYLVTRAPDEAKNLGNIMGMLLRNPRDKIPILDEGALTLLTTCATPSHTAKALQVELSIFREWFESVGLDLLTEVRLDDQQVVAKTLKVLLSGRGHEAMYAAQFKFEGFKTNQCARIIETAARRLAKEPAIFGRLWHSYWTPLQQAKLAEELRTFGPLIDRAAALCWQLAACLSAAEIALRYHQFQSRRSVNDRLLTIAFSKLRKYRTGMRSTGLAEPRRAARIAERFEEIGVLQQTEFCLDGDEFVPAKANAIPGGGPAFTPKDALEYACREIAALGPDLDSLLDLIDPLFDSWGKKSDRVDYSHMLYYDIVDSTATVAMRAGRNVEEHRERCNKLKEYINRWFDRSIGEAHRSQDEINCVNGEKTSVNDCKHVFLRGVNARRWAEKIISMLASTAVSLEMRVRIYFVPCSFAGSGAYRQGIDPKVNGLRFWEHWSRLAKKCAAFEAVFTAESHFFLIATKELIQRFQLGPVLLWENATDTIVESEIEGLSRRTAVRYGTLLIKGGVAVSL